MKILGNIVSGICLLICSGFTLKATSEVLTDTLNRRIDRNGTFFVETASFVAIVGSIGLLLLSTGMRLLGIKIKIAKNA